MAIITLNPTGSSVSSSSGIVYSNITIRGMYDLVGCESEASWLTCEIVENSTKLKISYNTNPESYSRTAEVRVYTDGGADDAIYTLEQLGRALEPSIVANPSSFVVDYHTQSKESNITIRDCTGVIRVVVAPASGTSASTWVSASFNSTTNKLTILFNEYDDFTENSRYAYCYVSSTIGLETEAYAILTLEQTARTGSISLNPTGSSVSYSGGVIYSNIIIDGEYTSISTSTSANWIIPEIENNRLKLTYSGNTSLNSRTGNVSVTIDEGFSTANYSLQQAAMVAPGITLSPTGSSVSSTAGLVYSNVSIQGLYSEVFCSTEDDWIECELMNNNTELAIGYSSNEELTARTGSVRVYIDGGTIDSYYTLTQAGRTAQPNIICTPNVLSASNLTQSVYSNITLIDITENLNITKSSEWITNINFNSSTNVLEITIGSNEGSSRTGYVTISANGVSKNITINQEGLDPQIYVTPNTFLFSAIESSGTSEINTTSISGRLNVSATTDWITFDYRYYYDEIVVSVPQYFGSEQRSGEVILKSQDELTTARITITQMGVSQQGTLKANPSAITISNSEQNILVNLEKENIYDSVQVSGDFTNYSVNGDNYTFTIAANSSTTTNNKVIRFKANNNSVSATTNISQLGTEPYLIITTNSKGINHAGGEILVGLLSNTNYSARTDSNWITISLLASNRIILQISSTTTNRVGRVYVSIPNQEEIIYIYQIQGMEHIIAGQDTLYTFAQNNIKYIVKSTIGSQFLYQGLAYAEPNSTGATINVTNLGKKFLTPKLNINMNTSAGTAGVGNDFEFSIYNNSNVLLNRYFIHGNWESTNNFNYSSGFVNLSRPINGHAVPNMLVLRSSYDYPHFLGTIAEYKKIGNNEIWYTNGVNSPAYVSNGQYCGNYAILYRNLIGGYDSFLIEANVRKQISSVKIEYKKPNTNIDKTQFNIRNFNSKIEDSFLCNTSWLTDEQSKIFAENLLFSPEVYLQDIKNNKLYSALIKEGSSEVKEFRNGRKLTNYQFTIYISQTRQFE